MPTSSVNRVPRNDDRRESILISPLFILFVTVKRIEWLVVRLGILRYRPQWPCWNTASFFETQRSFALVATSRVAVVSLCRRQEWQSEFSFLKRWGIRGENRRWGNPSPYDSPTDLALFMKVVLDNAVSLETEMRMDEWQHVEPFSFVTTHWPPN